MNKILQNNSPIFLDNNSSTPLDPIVKDYIVQLLPQLGANPSSFHSFGKKIRSLINQSRDTIAAYLKVKPQEIIFTSGGTEGANTAIRGIIPQNLPCHIISSETEHSCVHATLKELESRGYKVTYLTPGAYGAPTPRQVLEAITPNTKLIALMAVNNETGVKTDIDAIAKIAQDHAIPFFVDGVARLAKEPFTIPQGVTMMSFSGHKCHALQGIGFLFMRSGTKCRPILTGGEHEYGKRAGTENVIGIAALGKAVELLNKEIHSFSKYMEQLRDYFETLLQKELPNVLVNGEGPRISNVSNLAFSGVDGETLLIELDRAGVAASHGSACASGSLEPSHVLIAMGLPLERVHASLRFSFSRITTKEEIEEGAKRIIAIVKRLSPHLHTVDDHQQTKKIEC